MREGVAGEGQDEGRSGRGRKGWGEKVRERSGRGYENKWMAKENRIQ